MSRSISFTVEGDVNTLITITETDAGTLIFDIEVLDSGLLGDLRGFFFDLNDYDASAGDLSITGLGETSDLIGETLIEEGSVDRVTKDVSLKGSVSNELGDFDVGIEFGTTGISRDDISSASFELASGTGSLSLDSLNLADLGLRYTSVGTEGDREDSSKIGGETSGILNNDEMTVLENDEGSLDLYGNDTLAFNSDGTRADVTAVTGADGTEYTAVSGGFEHVVVIDGKELGTVFVSTDGIATFTANGADVDSMAHDDLAHVEFTYTVQNDEGDIATADVQISIDGVNDQPDAEDVSLNVLADDAFDPNDPFLVGDGVTGTFVGSDADDGDVLDFQITSAVVDDLGNIMGEVVNNGDGTFTFNPLDDFLYLNEGETLDVSFEYIAMDDSGVGTTPIAPEESDTSDPATVTITVEGVPSGPPLDDEPMLDFGF